MTLRTSLLAAKDRIRAAVLSPSGLDMTPHQLTIRVRTWTGGRKDADPPQGLPAFTDSDLVLPQQYKVRQLTMREVSSSGGKYRAGDIIVEHITPYDGDSTGYTPAQLQPTIAGNAQELIYLLTGFGGLVGEYRIREFRGDKSLSYALVLRSVRDTP